MPAPFWQADAFTAAPFTGNPAAVCLFESEPDAALMEKLAAEMNLSETAFLCKLGEARYGLRWFTPVVEVPLCGHATLASAAALKAVPAEGFGGVIATAESAAPYDFVSLYFSPWYGIDEDPVASRAVIVVEGRLR